DDRTRARLRERRGLRRHDPGDRRVVDRAVAVDHGSETADAAAGSRARMRAIVCRRYGSPDALELAELEKPSPAADEVLIRVRAASVNAFDQHFMRGEPYLVRAAFGLRGPKKPRLGVDVSGEVESVGAN